MKSFLIFVVGLMLAGQTIAQTRTVERSFPVKSDPGVNLELKFGDTIVIHSWDREEISFRADIEINGGKLNEALLLQFSPERNKVEIDADFNEKLLTKGRREDCPKQRYSFYNTYKEDDQVICTEIAYEIYLPRNTHLVIETINADIELHDLQGPIDAKSISGFVDLSWPAWRGANISIKTISGEAYTNLANLKFLNRKDHPSIVGYELKGVLGKGGPSIRLKSVSGNIYLRKS